MASRMHTCARGAADRRPAAIGNTNSHLSDEANAMFLDGKMASTVARPAGAGADSLLVFTRGGAFRLALCSGLLGAGLGFAGGFKVGEAIYADERERKRFANTVKLTVATAGTTVGILMLVRVAFALAPAR